MVYTSMEEVITLSGNIHFFFHSYDIFILSFTMLSSKLLQKDIVDMIRYFRGGYGRERIILYLEL